MNSPERIVEDGAASPDDREVNPPAANPDLDMDDSDNAQDDESDLSEVDEAEFADFDPEAVAVTADDRPRVDIDEDVARTLKASKKKKSGDGEPKKPKEKKREKAKKRRGDADASDDGADGQMLDGKRARKPKSTSEGGKDGKERARERRLQQIRDDAADEETLSPEERRRRALDRAMDAALKNPNKRRRKKDEDVCSEGSTVVNAC